MPKSNNRRISRIHFLIGISVAALAVIVACDNGEGSDAGRSEEVPPSTTSTAGGTSGYDEPEKVAATSNTQGDYTMGEDSRVEEKPTAISYKRQITPIFAEKCIDCHHPGNAVKVDFTNIFDSEVGLINRPNSWPESSRPILVVPGDPEASALMLKIEATDLDPHIEGDPMPWAIPRLTEEEIAAIRIWIERGASEDDYYRTTVRRIFGDGVSLGSRGGKCAYCHYPESQFGPDLSRPFDSERGAVGVDADRGGVRIVPGDPEASVLFLRVIPEKIPMRLQPLMPLHYERVTDEEAALIRQWIQEGALNN